MQDKGQTNQNFNQQKLAQVIAKCWNDEKYKERFIQSPKSVLKEEGVISGDHFNFQVHENTQNEFHLVIPEKGQVSLNEEELKGFAGGLPGCGYTGKCN